MNKEHAAKRATELAAYTVDAFCEAHGIGRNLFYRAIREGWGPVTFLCGNKRLTSVEAAARWRAEMETRTNGTPDSDPTPDAEQAAA